MGFGVHRLAALSVLRRLGDVMLTLVPLALAGLVTMEAMTLLGMPFDFANIIALPLLLGVGVAFKIYYIVTWRKADRSSPDAAHPRSLLQRSDDGDGVWQPLVLEQSPERRAWASCLPCPWPARWRRPCFSNRS